MAPRGDVFCDHHFFSWFSPRKLNLRKQFFMPDSKYTHPACYYTRFWEKINGPFCSPPTHPPSRTTCGRVHSCWKKYLKRHYCGLRASRGVLSSFFYVTFLDFFAVEIKLFMIFRFTLVYARVFSNRQISSLWKIHKSLITPYKQLVEDF